MPIGGASERVVCAGGSGAWPSLSRTAFGRCLQLYSRPRRFPQSSSLNRKCLPCLRCYAEIRFCSITEVQRCRFAGDLRAICARGVFAFSPKLWDRSHAEALFRGTPERHSLINWRRISQIGVGGRISEVEGAATDLQPPSDERTKRIFPGFLLFSPKPQDRSHSLKPGVGKERCQYLSTLFANRRPAIIHFR